MLKTAYEMRISDWSSDVCSSDLSSAAAPAAARRPSVRPRRGAHWPRSQVHHRAARFQVQRVIALAIIIACIVEPRDQDTPAHPLAAFEAQLITVERHRQNGNTQPPLGIRSRTNENENHRRWSRVRTHRWISVVH